MYERLKELKFGMKIRNTRFNDTGYIYGIDITNGDNISVSYAKNKKFNNTLGEVFDCSDTLIDFIEVINSKGFKNNDRINTPEQITIHKFNIGDYVCDRLDSTRKKYIILSISLEWQGAIVYTILGDKGIDNLDECMLELWDGGDGIVKN